MSWGRRGYARCPLRLALLFLALATLGCHRGYELRGVMVRGPLAMKAHLPDGYPRFLAVAITNPTSEIVTIDWGSSHIQDFRGFELPVRVEPADAVSFIYPKGTVIYHVYPAHEYLPADIHRAHVTGEIVNEELFEHVVKEAQRPLKLLLRVGSHRFDKPVKRIGGSMTPLGPSRRARIRVRSRVDEHDPLVLRGGKTHAKSKQEQAGDAEGGSASGDHEPVRLERASEPAASTTPRSDPDHMGETDEWQIATLEASVAERSAGGQSAYRWQWEEGSYGSPESFQGVGILVNAGAALVGMNTSLATSAIAPAYSVGAKVLGRFNLNWAILADLNVAGLSLASYETVSDFDSYEATYVRGGLGVRYAPLVTKFFEVANSVRLGFAVTSHTTTSESSELEGRWQATEFLVGDTVEFVVLPAIHGFELGVFADVDLLFGSGGFTKAFQNLPLRYNITPGAQAGYRF